MSELGVYPVKSLRGLTVPVAQLEPWGFVGDRRWMVVDPEGRFVTQRSTPAMALVHTRVRDDGSVELRTAGAGAVVPQPVGPAITVSVWRDTTTAVRADPVADRWLSELLDRPVHLVYMDRPAAAREIDQEYGRPGEPVSFADGYPLLITTDGSLAALDEWQRTAGARVLPMDRFRPSIVVAGTPAWAEDRWREIAIGGVRLRLVKPCARCVITTVVPETGTIEPGGPLRQLGAHRPKVDFGVNAIPDTVGPLRVGDEVRVLTEADHHLARPPSAAPSGQP